MAVGHIGAEKYAPTVSSHRDQLAACLGRGAGRSSIRYRRALTSRRVALVELGDHLTQA